MSRLTLPDLTTKALDAARLLAQEGCRGTPSAVPWA